MPIGDWPTASRRYFVVVGLGNLAWEVPQLPPTGAGISPFAQWIVVPPAAFWWVCRPFAGSSQWKENPS